MGEGEIKHHLYKRPKAPASLRFTRLGIQPLLGDEPPFSPRDAAVQQLLYVLLYFRAVKTFGRKRLLAKVMFTVYWIGGFCANKKSLSSSVNSSSLLLYKNKSDARHITFACLASHSTKMGLLQLKVTWCKIRHLGTPKECVRSKIKRK